MRVRFPSRNIEAASCPSFTVFDGSQDWVIVHHDVVAGSSPASGTKCRSSSVVEHVFPVRLLSVGFSAGRRLWVLVDPAIPVQIRSVACDGGATLSTPGNSTVAFLPALFDGPKTSGYLSLVRIQSGAHHAPVAKWYSNSRVVPCPSFFRRVECRPYGKQHTR